MKLFATVSFLFALILFTGTAIAQISTYGIDVILDDTGKSFVELSLMFTEPVNDFKFIVFAKIENFNITSTDGPAFCNLTVGEISSVDCDLQLTPENKAVEIYFETNDFIKTLDNRFYFNGDFTLNKNISEVFTSVRLSEGLVLPEEEIEKIIFPTEGLITSDGRRIIVVWRYNNVTENQPLKFQVIYELTEIIPTGITPSWQYILIGVGAVIITAIFIIYRIRKPKEVILSVLSDYERKVIEIITAAGGEVKQKRIVQETNLSKAKVSRLIKSLVERGLIEAQRVGRTNKLKLVKKKFEF